ncbi:MAG: hypothetical protein ABSE56_20005 [Bryobacteraceae bacterium]|jgi:hypothetical protein
MALILDGNSIRDQILKEREPRVTALAVAHRPPGLGGHPGR